MWAFPVLASFTLTCSWARELKRWGKTALIAVTVDVPDREPVYVAHYRNVPVLSSAAEAAGLIRSLADPRGYEIMVPRRIAPSEICRVRVLPRAIGWRYYPGARGRPMRLCDCPVCLPRSEVKARRYRDAVRSRLAREAGKK